MKLCSHNVHPVVVVFIFSSLISLVSLNYHHEQISPYRVAGGYTELNEKLYGQLSSGEGVYVNTFDSSYSLNPKAFSEATLHAKLAKEAKKWGLIPSFQEVGEGEPSDVRLAGKSVQVSLPISLCCHLVFISF